MPNSSLHPAALERPQAPLFSRPSYRAGRLNSCACPVRFEILIDSIPSAGCWILTHLGKAFLYILSEAGLICTCAVRSSHAVGPEICLCHLVSSRCPQSPCPGVPHHLSYFVSCSRPRTSAWLETEGLTVVVGQACAVPGIRYCECHPLPIPASKLKNTTTTPHFGYFHSCWFIKKVTMGLGLDQKQN